MQKARQHLQKCMREENFIPFPKIAKEETQFEQFHNIHEIDINCECGLPDIYEDMVGCEGRCNRWWHKNCLGVDILNSSWSKQWKCNNCVQKRRVKKSLKLLRTQELKAIEMDNQVISTSRIA